MDFPLPVKALNLLVSSGKPTKDPISIKIGQHIEAKILQVSLESNIIKLQLGKTTVEAQPQPSLPSNQNSDNSPSSFTSGQTLKLLVTKLIPTPEFKIEKTAISTERVSHNKTNSAKHQHVDLANKTETKPITLTVLNKLDTLTKAIDNKLPSLQVGQKLPAKVISFNNNQIQLQLLPEQKTTNTSQQQPSKSVAIISLDQQKSDLQKPSSHNKAVAPKPLIKTGQTVNLEVTKAGAEPQFKILANKPLSITVPEKIMSETVKQMLPIQRPSEEFVNRLILNLPTLTKNTNLPEALQRLAQKILQNLPSKNLLSQPQRIKQSINNSGLFLESKLAQVENNPKLQTQTDFKANLLKFLHALKQLPTPAPQPESNILDRETNILKQLHNSGESSVAKLVLDQLNSLPKEDNPKQIWHLEIPYVDQKNSQTLSLQIEKDKQNQAKDGKENWSVSITLNPPGLGKLHCKISCYDQTINTHFWSELTKTTNLINRNLEYLKSQLEESGLRTGLMESHQDIPTLKPTLNLSNTNLVDEQI